MSAFFSASGFLVHTPCGPRKSAMPDSVEIPAPVRTTMRSASSIQRLTSASVDMKNATPGKKRTMLLILLIVLIVLVLGGGFGYGGGRYRGGGIGLGGLLIVILLILLLTGNLR